MKTTWRNYDYYISEPDKLPWLRGYRRGITEITLHFTVVGTPVYTENQTRVSSEILIFFPLSFGRYMIFFPEIYYKIHGIFPEFSEKIPHFR